MSFRTEQPQPQSLLLQVSLSSKNIDLVRKAFGILDQDKSGFKDELRCSPTCYWGKERINLELKVPGVGTPARIWTAPCVSDSPSADSDFPGLSQQRLGLYRTGSLSRCSWPGPLNMPCSYRLALKIFSGTTRVLTDEEPRRVTRMDTGRQAWTVSDWEAVLLEVMHPPTLPAQTFGAPYRVRHHCCQTQPPPLLLQ